MNTNQTPMFQELPQDNIPEPKPEYINNLSPNLNFLMDSNPGLTCRILAIECEVPEQTMNDWINGKVRLQLLDKRLVKVARRFELSLEELVFEDLRLKH